MEKRASESSDVRFFDKVVYPTKLSCSHRAGLAGAVGMVFNTVTVEIAVRELSLVTVSVGPVVDALAVEFSLDEISLVAVAAGPVEDTLAGAFVGDPVARPYLFPLAQ